MPTLSAPHPSPADTAHDAVRTAPPSDPNMPVGVPETLAIRPWHDPVLDRFGHDARSAYVERFWLGVLGPSAVWFLRLVATGLEEHPDGFDMDVAATARRIGIGAGQGRNGAFARTVERVGSFGMARLFDTDTLVVRHRIPPLTQRQLARLPRAVRDEHARWIDAAPEVNQVEAMRRRARALALSLLELGEDVAAAEHQLHRWKFHPAVAHEALRWATDEHARRRGELGVPVA